MSTSRRGRSGSADEREFRHHSRELDPMTSVPARSVRSIEAPPPKPDPVDAVAAEVERTNRASRRNSSVSPSTELRPTRVAETSVRSACGRASSRSDSGTARSSLRATRCSRPRRRRNGSRSCEPSPKRDRPTSARSCGTPRSSTGRNPVILGRSGARAAVARGSAGRPTGDRRRSRRRGYAIAQ
jgi:hypothetical protein